ncbi:MAG: PEGA domain-containing protein [Ignavibacteria bacterium]|nr:PEGA domain-containing protein [Ignavibacteria bacterium]MBT8381613.1 PEGA domain-containing protein [Ignavibacteria bacterium]MBT8393193.1 PEGA domain-containing protein [Ignavibacteria bacterium]NNL21251.1 PEGA domain-containing protein [Ignavibacteriaceae bacterium]
MNVSTKVIVTLALILFFLIINSGCGEDAPTNTNIQPQNGIIFADSDPPGAEIFLQNTSTGKFTPDSIINLAPDSYDVRLKQNDSMDSSLVANVKAGLVTTVYVDFTQFFGNLFVDSSPQGAQIFLDNVSTGDITPAIVDSLFPSQYAVTLKLAGFSDTTVTVQIQTGSQGLFISYFPVTTTTTTTISTTATGTGSLPPGVSGSISNTRVALYTDLNNWNLDITFKFGACDANGNYTLADFVPGNYFMDAWKDNDNNSVWGSSGDYIWIFGSGTFPNYTLVAKSFPEGNPVVTNFEVFIVP